MTSLKTAATSVGVLLAATTLAACGGNRLQTTAQGDAAATPSPSASPSPAASPAPSSSRSSSAKPASSSASPKPAGPPVCAAGDLKVSLQPQGAAMGSQYSLLTFRNTSRGTCTMNGHPGVSFVGKHDGTQIGQPAVRTGALKTITLAPGESTSALLQIADAGNYPASSCAPTTVDGLRVYPPDSRVSVFVPLTTQACQGSTTGSPQMQVSAVGHTG